MCDVYVHLSGKDLDEDLYRAAGIQIEEKKEVSPLLESECPRCGTKNPANNTFCGLCACMHAVTRETEKTEGGE